MSDDQKPIFRADSWDFPGGKHTQIIRSDSDGFVESQLLGDDLLLEAAMLAEPRRHRLAASSGAMVEALFGNLEHPKSPHSEGSESPDTPLKVTGRHTGTVFAESPRQQLSWSVPNESQAAGRPPVSPFQAQQVAGFAPLMFQQQQQQQQAMLHYQAQQQPMPSAHQYERLLMQQRAQQAQLQAEAANLLIPAKAMSMPLRTVGNRRGFGSFSTIEATETQQVHETAVRRVQSFTPGLKSRKPTPTPPSTGNVSDEEGSGTASSDEEEDLQDGSTIKRRKTGKGSGKRGGRKPRRMTCRNCATHQTPQWRCGPEGPRTLCNACGVRFKKGLPLGPGTPGYVARSASTELMVE
ncbi:hypothetical protein WJX72_006477 [[Myrmecia] bisecta]|uniref:GATA-type domain-containing protein n=1 Tax=[Myrmecia] bisecta TaxID=41462 RepID=A0AAW1PQ88_9CHLO